MIDTSPFPSSSLRSISRFVLRRRARRAAGRSPDRADPQAFVRRAWRSQLNDSNAHSIDLKTLVHIEIAFLQGHEVRLVPELMAEVQNDDDRNHQVTGDEIKPG